MLGSWLPYALADILVCIIAASGANPPRLPDILSSWGLGSEAEEVRDSDTDNALKALSQLETTQKG